MSSNTLSVAIVASTQQACFRCATWGVALAVVMNPVDGVVNIRERVCILCAKASMSGPPPFGRGVQFDMRARRIGKPSMGAAFPMLIWHWVMLPGESYWTDG